MKKGVVVEYSDDFVTLLTPDGQFLKAKNNEGVYELGEEISFFPVVDKREEVIRKRKRNHILSYFSTRMAKAGAISAIAIIFFMISFLPFFQNDQVYAYMSIDINPSFEVGVDDQLNVISLEPLNDEANKLMKKVSDWENKPFDEIVDRIVGECKLEGYVYPGKEIVITTVVNEEDKKAQNELQEDISKIRSSYEEDQMIVKTIEADQETREKAQKQGVSTGKYIELTEKEVKPVKEKETTPVEQNNTPSTQEKEDTTTTDPVKQETSTTVEENQQTKNELNSKAKEKLNEVKNELKGQKNEQKQNKGNQVSNNNHDKQKQKNNNRHNQDNDDDDRDNRKDRKDRKDRDHNDDDDRHKRWNSNRDKDRDDREERKRNNNRDDD